MTTPRNREARSALAALEQRPWRGRAWRAHFRSYEATDHGGSLRSSGRYHRGPDRFPPEESWPALYLALSPEVSLGEVLRRLPPELLNQLNEYRISELDVELHAVLDCRDAEVLGLKPGDLLDDYDLRITQEIGAAAVGEGVEALLIPSATRLGDNLVVFPAQLQSTSRLAVVGSRDPLLYVRR